MDSYKKFMEDFKINDEDFIKWGIENTIFPEIDKVKPVWEELKHNALNNGKVFMRGAGRDAATTKYYLDFYKYAFGNDSVEKDPTNNYNPQKCIELVTGKKRNADIMNYQVSHIWGKTKNILLFVAPWNICLTPKIIDPFTGHESSGGLSKKFKEKFLANAYSLYGDFVEEYNDIITKLNIQEKLEAFKKEVSPGENNKAFYRFLTDASERELSAIAKNNDLDSITENNEINGESDVSSVNANYAKAIGRIPHWAEKPNQNNHKVVRAYFKALYTYGQATLEAMQTFCSNKNNTRLYVENFKSHFDSLKTDSGNNHGKIFEYDKNTGIVKIWPVVADTLAEYEFAFTD